jgi:hypothetical protein
MVDGNQVTTRGGAIPPTGGDTAHPVIGALTNPAAWPSARTFAAITKGSSSGASTGVLNIDTDGTLRVDYDAATDTFTRWLTATYTAI